MLNTNDILKQLKSKEDLCHCIYKKRLSFLQDFRVTCSVIFFIEDIKRKRDYLSLL